MVSSISSLGFGVGLRSQHYPLITSEWPKSVDWFEAVTENYMDSGGRPVHILEQIRQHYPVALHGVALSIGSTDPLNSRYLERLKILVDRIDPVIVSDHVCWSGVDQQQLHDLLPLPFTEESVRHVVSRVDQIQNFLGRKILLENVSSYITYTHSTLPEWEFLKAIATRSGCGLLLDLNNIYVNAKNHNFDARIYLEAMNPEQIEQFHLAGHTDMGDFLFDTHSKSVVAPVWDLYRRACELWGPVSTLIEWDEDIPDFARLVEEVDRAREIFKETKDLSFPRKRESGPLDPRFRGDDKQELSLADLQRKFKSAMMGEKVQDLPLNPQAGVAGLERISVYAGGYPARIQESLNEVYEAIHPILGDALFHQMAEAYAQAYPSHNYNLNVSGRHLPEFLKHFPLTQTLPFLPELAQLEWAIAESFHAFDAEPMTQAEWSTLSIDDWEQTVLKFQPSVKIISSAWPILDLWSARKTSEKEIKTQVEGRPQTVLVSRRGLQVYCELLSAEQALFLSKLMSGKTIGEACEFLIDENSDALPPIGDWFARWMQQGMIRGK